VRGLHDTHSAVCWQTFHPVHFGVFGSGGIQLSQLVDEDVGGVSETGKISNFLASNLN
jgi:hypothetical protein